MSAMYIPPEPLRSWLRREAIDGYDLCRLAEYPLFVVVSDALRRTFEGVRCTGYSFEALV
jgi:hypothetical protein